LGYIIEYIGGSANKTNIQEKGKGSKTGLLAAILFAILILAVGQKNLSELADYLIPGNKVVTKDALSGFVRDVQDGDSFKDAITTFCKEIIQNGEGE